MDVALTPVLYTHSLNAEPGGPADCRPRTSSSPLACHKPMSPAVLMGA